ncbi:hypothetical protein QTP88_004772 [Uroleucon formosanum]
MYGLENYRIIFSSSSADRHFMCEYFMNCAVSKTDDLSRISLFQRLANRTAVFIISPCDSSPVGAVLYTSSSPSYSGTINALVLLCVGPRGLHLPSSSHPAMTPLVVCKNRFVMTAASHTAVVVAVKLLDVYSRYIGHRTSVVRSRDLIPSVWFVGRDTCTISCRSVLMYSKLVIECRFAVVAM